MAYPQLASCMCKELNGTVRMRYPQSVSCMCRELIQHCCASSMHQVLCSLLGAAQTRDVRL